MSTFLSFSAVYMQPFTGIQCAGNNVTSKREERRRSCSPMTVVPVDGEVPWRHLACSPSPEEESGDENYLERESRTAGVGLARC